MRSSGGNTRRLRAAKAARSQSRPDDLPSAVAAILEAVRDRGDAAVREFSLRFDGCRRLRLEVSARERSAVRSVGASTRGAIRFAARRIERFARLQRASLRPFTHREDGLVLSQRLVPVERVGIYVPGGRHPLCSTVLMGAIPARVAGCREIVLCTPPGPGGRVAPEILAAAREARVDRVFAVGGAQAIAAMAFGTRSIPRVDLLVGPGNRWVTEAKAQLGGACGIEFLAGPTELAVIADGSADADCVAADLLAQAEHDPAARVWLLALDRAVAERVGRRLAARAAALQPGSPNRSAASASLRRLQVVPCASLAEAARRANDIAPEHLSVQIARPARLLPRLRSYGSLFAGAGSAVAFGDYVAGPNHVLPTSGAARHTGGLSVLRFLKVVTTQEIRPAGHRRLAPAARQLARLEGLAAHEASLRARQHEAGAARAVLFDFNGVLVDDERFHWKAFRAVARPLGIDLTWTLYERRYLQGDDDWVGRQLLADAGAREEPRRLEELIWRKRLLYRRLCGRTLAVDPGIAALLRELAARVPLAIVSGAAREEIEEALVRGGVRELFETIVAAEDVRRCKPHPEGYQRARRALGLGPRVAVVAVEDAPGGIRAAVGAGCRVVGIPSSFPAPRLRAAGAGRIVSGLAGPPERAPARAEWLLADFPNPLQPRTSRARR